MGAIYAPGIKLNQSPVQKGIETRLRLLGGDPLRLNQSPVQKGIETG